MAQELKQTDSGSRMNAGMITGLLIFAAGVILLLDRMNVLDAGNLLRFWPAALVIFGLIKLFEPNGWGVRIQGLVLIAAGVLLLLTAIGVLHIHFWDLWPLALIAFGLSMIFGGLDAKGGSCWKKGAASASRLNELAVFGGGERRINTSDFEGGQLMAIFGGFKVDLTKAAMKQSQAIIDVSAIFGGGEVRIPEEWTVVMQSVGIFGGYSDSTRHPKTDDPSTVKSLIVRGVAIFGGVEIRN